MTLVIKTCMYIISMHSSNFVIEKGNNHTDLLNWKYLEHHSLFRYDTMFSKQLQTVQGSIQPPPSSNNHTLFCAKSDCLKIKETISSTTSVHHSPFNTASYPTKLVSPTIPLPASQISQEKYFTLIFTFSQQELIILVFWVWHCAVLQVDTDFSDMLPNPSTLKMEAIHSFKISVSIHSTAWSQNQKAQLRNYLVPSVYVKYLKQHRQYHRNVLALLQQGTRVPPTSAAHTAYAHTWFTPPGRT